MASFPTIVVKEAGVELVVPDPGAYRGGGARAPALAPVFYNPRMAFNRDVAVGVVQAYQRSVGRLLRVCEPLTGCGVRAIRFAKSVDGIAEVVSSDINSKAVELARLNANLNDVSEKVQVFHTDANRLLCEHASPGGRFDVVDIDPFGSPTPFIDAAIRALRNGGLLCVTATDMAPLCGVHRMACIRKYGGAPLRSEYCHEVAVRLLIAAISREAAKHEFGLKPLLSYAVDHYARAYAIVEKGARKADRTLNEIGYLLHCFSCLNRTVVKQVDSVENFTCGVCGSKMVLAGPLWVGKLHDLDFLRKVLEYGSSRSLASPKRYQRLVSAAIEEADAPATYYVLDELCSKLKRPVPRRRRVIESLRERKLKAFETLFHPRGVKTDANVSVLLEVVKSV